MGTLVPLPDQGLDDVTATVEYLDAFDARLVPYLPPGLSRYHPRYAPGIFETWVPELVEHVSRCAKADHPGDRQPVGYVSVTVEPIVEG